MTNKENDVAVRMSKRAGTFTKLSDVIEAVGTDVARFFYLNRKADVSLDFDLAVAVQKTQENPVFYIQYAYVRTGSVLSKAFDEKSLKAFVQALRSGSLEKNELERLFQHIGADEIEVLVKIASFNSVLSTIEQSYQTHLLAHFAFELAHKFHNYYANNRIIELSDLPQTQMRLLMVIMVRDALELCLELLGLSKPEKM